jgi:protein SSD1
LTLIRPNNKRAQEEKDQQLRNGGAPLYKKDAPRIVWFKATDKRVPLIAIPIEQTPDDFMENTEKYATRLFVVREEEGLMQRLSSIILAILSLGIY